MTTTTRRKPATPEQTAAAEAKRAAFHELARRVGGMSDAEREAMAARMPVVTIEGRALSAHNACLAIMQRDAGVTIVGGFRQWIAAGRSVRKGEHGIMIWAPRGKSAEERDDDDRPGFVPVYVFDVSQTDESEAAR